MDQISRPILFLLIAVIGFAGAWMTVLRPQAQEAAAPPPVSAPPQEQPTSGLARAAGAAEGAAAASDATTAAKQEAADNASGAPAPAGDPAPAPTANAKPEATAKATPAQPVVDRRTTVLLFAGTGADDTVARDVVRSVRRPGVRVIVASLRDVGSYSKLLGGVEVTASPTILVIGKNRTARRIEGLPDAAQVEQALRAAR